MASSILQESMCLSKVVLHRIFFYFLRRWNWCGEGRQMTEMLILFLSKSSQFWKRIHCSRNRQIFFSLLPFSIILLNWQYGVTFLLTIQGIARHSNYYNLHLGHPGTTRKRIERLLVVCTTQCNSLILIERMISIFVIL